MTATEKPVVIIGAGVVGLTLAHALQNANIPFNVYERDEHIDSRDQGWAITLHWALPYIRSMLDEPTLAAVDAVQVDLDVARNDTGNFLFLNLATLETKFRIPPNDRRRVNREKMRKALLQGVAGNVHWKKSLRDIELLGDGSEGVKAVFEDGSSAQGSVVVGAEGSNSRTRKFLLPSTYRNIPIPIKLLGVAINMTPEQAAPLRAIDPLLFQGCHPDTSNYLWISVLDTPDTNGTRGTPEEHFKIQYILSWPFKSDADAVPPADKERVAEMKRRSAEFHPVLRRAVDDIPDNTTVVEIAIQDWPCLQWDNRSARVTLAGDAAHAMTMFRGEAANHGILDAHNLCDAMKALYSGEKTRQEALDGYEAEMRERTAPAVLLSREACVEAHNYHNLNENSAVLKRRALPTK